MKPVRTGAAKKRATHPIRRQPQDHVQQPGEQRQRRRERDDPRRVGSGARHRRDAAGRDGGHRGARADEELTRRAEGEVPHQGERHRVEAVLDRDAGDGRVRERLRHHQGPEGGARDEVGRQPVPAVARQPGEEGEEPPRAQARAPAPCRHFVSPSLASRSPPRADVGRRQTGAWTSSSGMRASAHQSGGVGQDGRVGHALLARDRRQLVDHLCLARDDGVLRSR